MEKKYYFVGYWYSNDGGHEYLPHNTRIEKHPLKWEIDENEERGINEHYLLFSWQQITEAEYLLYK